MHTARCPTDELFEVMQAKLDVRELTAVGSPIAMVQCLSERSHANIGSMAMRPCAAELMDAHSRCSYIRANATSWSGRKCAKSAQTSP